MGRYDSACTMCGRTIRTGGTLCRPCYTRKPVPTCTQCGSSVSNRRTKLCRSCWAMRDGGPPHCQECGQRLRRTGARLCWSCWAKRGHPLCEDCGATLPGAGRSRKRCWSCWMKYRKSRERRVCSFPGCNRPHQAKGFCIGHYLRERRRVEAPRVDRPARALVGLSPCQLCGFNEITSHVHRIVAQGPYTLGNMVALCATCHELVHRGKRPCPPAWQPV